MTWRVLIDWLPNNNENRAVPLAHARICHLEHERGANTSNMHAYFEVSLGEDAPDLLNDERNNPHHLVASVILKDYPRFQGSVWDLLAAALQEAERGRPVIHDGLTLADIPQGG